MISDFLNGRKVEDLAVAWRWSESNGKHWFDWGHWQRAKDLGCLIEYAIPANEILNRKEKLNDE